MFCVVPGVRLWLASTSPRRRQLLAATGLTFSLVKPSGHEPEWQPTQTGAAYACLTAASKAASLTIAPSQENQVVIAADTVVVCGNRVLGKPENTAQALAMLLELNGRWHQVYTGVHILAGTKAISFSEETAVHFGQWPLAALKAYAATGESLDKAGAYGIQGRGAFLSDRIEGDWSNVVGLPVGRLIRELLGLDLIEPQYGSDPVPAQDMSA